MQKNRNVIIIGLVTLVVGLGLGYLIGMNTMMPGLTHTMPHSQTMNGTTMSMADMMTSMNAKLQGKNGDEFDKAFLEEMITHHQGAVSMAQAALKNAKHNEIKNVANTIISAQNKEIAEMQRWQKMWYPQQ